MTNNSVSNIVVVRIFYLEWKIFWKIQSEVFIFRHILLLLLSWIFPLPPSFRFCKVSSKIKRKIRYFLYIPFDLFFSFFYLIFRVIHYRTSWPRVITFRIESLSASFHFYGRFPFYSVTTGRRGFIFLLSRGSDLSPNAWDFIPPIFFFFFRQLEKCICYGDWRDKSNETCSIRSNDQKRETTRVSENYRTQANACTTHKKTLERVCKKEKEKHTIHNKKSYGWNF